MFLSRPGQEEYAPRDTEYFTVFRDISDAMRAGAPTSVTVYDAFVSIYEATTGKLEPDVIGLIARKALLFGRHRKDMEVWLAVVYAGMVAEENKAHTRLGKRVKRLGMHQVLILGIAPVLAATWSRGRKWNEIAKECAKHGF